MPAVDPLQVQTELLERMKTLHVQHMQSLGRRTVNKGSGASNGVKGTVAHGSDGGKDMVNCEGIREDDLPLAVQFVRSCPPLTNPTWAMEELLRINPNVAVWTGSTLSSTVWAPPASGHCPFGTTSGDFVRHR
ncbi:hypothetical protein ERJ75_001623000 [Trypanosoma vivax]|uniref:Uncharacterized protein n=1 Tax=Trypanosoma vivax (strain Y486) TaxID=1055687 RepID=G0TT84_TRYVY|nr:hypothetical protein TRVL_03231 [Trypanosoma vivax]KAH8605780.1 hypothetical protein ERJ75_001623000 [Trypanosoma vivax]CCC47165.1 conserved hypothetical protein [Trypanosoma vivax Y486]